MAVASKSAVIKGLEAETDPVPLEETGRFDARLVAIGRYTPTGSERQLSSRETNRSASYAITIPLDFGSTLGFSLTQSSQIPQKSRIR